MGRDSPLGVSEVQDGVSIHAPAWGATRTDADGPRAVEVSIHAPAWGATDCSGGWRGTGTVSIHAPAWGATNPYMVPPPFVLVSIHAPAWGATSQAAAGLLKVPLFQFTRPRGARPLSAVP